MRYYDVYYTDKPLPAGAQPDFSLALPLVFVTKDEALKGAFKLIHSGAIVWKIEGPDGFHIERAEIERQYDVFRHT